MKRGSTPVKLAVVSIATRPAKPHSDASPKALSSGSRLRCHTCQASVILPINTPT